jgi:hypothetical protein
MVAVDGTKAAGSEILKSVAESVFLESELGFRFFGQTISVSAVEPDPNSTANRERLVECLRSAIYLECYSHLPPTSYDPLRSQADTFIEKLAAANSVHDRWDGGWVITDIDVAGFITAEKEGRTTVLSASELAIDGRFNSNILEGAEITVRRQGSSFSWQPGFYVVYGEHPQVEEAETKLLRLYFNTNSTDIFPLLKLMTSNLNRYQVPHQLKCPSYVEGYQRVDSMVVYIDRRFFDFVVRILSEHHSSIEKLLEPATPVFTKRLRPGIGFAEDPGRGQSFGGHRCGILAEGIIRAHQLGITSTDERVGILEREFLSHGIDLAKPYLNPGSKDSYTFADPAN